MEGGDAFGEAALAFGEEVEEEAVEGAGGGGVEDGGAVGAGGGEGRGERGVGREEGVLLGGALGVEQEVEIELFAGGAQVEA